MPSTPRRYATGTRGQGDGAAEVGEHHHVRDRRRSTQAPAKSESSRIGACSTARRTPSCAGAGVERDHGDERQDHLAGLFAELGGGLAHPEPAEVMVPPHESPWGC